MHICATPLESPADNVKVTEAVAVYALPLLIVIDPVGGVESHEGVVEFAALLCALWFPALSTADTV
jgi:hypothetical protein